MLAGILEEPGAARVALPPHKHHHRSFDRLLRKEWKSLFRGEPKFTIEHFAKEGGLAKALGGKVLRDAHVHVDLGPAMGGRREFIVVPEDAAWLNRLKSHVAAALGFKAPEKDYLAVRLLEVGEEGRRVEVRQDDAALQAILDGRRVLVAERLPSIPPAPVLPAMPTFMPELVPLDEATSPLGGAAAAAGADEAREDADRLTRKGLRDLRERFVARVGASLDGTRGDYGKTKEVLLSALQDPATYPAGSATAADFWRAHGVRDAGAEMTACAGSLASYVCKISGAIGGRATTDTLRAAPTWDELADSFVERKPSVGGLARRSCPAPLPSTEAAGSKMKMHRGETRSFHSHHYHAGHGASSSRPSRSVSFKTSSGANVSFSVARASAPLDASDFGVDDALASALVRADSDRWGSEWDDAFGDGPAYGDAGYSSDENPTQHSLACMSDKVHMIERDPASGKSVVVVVAPSAAAIGRRARRRARASEDQQQQKPSKKKDDGGAPKASASRASKPAAASSATGPAQMTMMATGSPLEPHGDLVSFVASAEAMLAPASALPEAEPAAEELPIVPCASGCAAEAPGASPLPEAEPTGPDASDVVDVDEQVEAPAEEDDEVVASESEGEEEAPLKPKPTAMVPIPVPGQAAPPVPAPEAEAPAQAAPPPPQQPAEEGPVVGLVRVVNASGTERLVSIGGDAHVLQPGTMTEYAPVRASSRVDLGLSGAPRFGSGYASRNVERLRTTIVVGDGARVSEVSDDFEAGAPAHDRSSVRVINVVDDSVKLELLRPISKGLQFEASLAAGQASPYSAVPPGEYLARVSVGGKVRAPVEQVSLKHRNHHTIVVHHGGALALLTDERHEHLKAAEAKKFLARAEVVALLRADSGVSGVLVAPSDSALAALAHGDAGPLQEYFAAGAPTELLKHRNAAGLLAVRSESGRLYVVSEKMTSVIDAQYQMVHVRSMFPHPHRPSIVVMVVDGVAEGFPVDR